MPGLLQTISAYIPPNIVRDVLKDTSPAPLSSACTEHFFAAVLFADISGFTPLTEALGQRGAEGPEELTRLLNRYFSWMIAFIETQGGEIVKFGGDALTAVFRTNKDELGVAVRRAMQSAETMQSVMDEFNVMESSAGLVSLEMEVGIGAGQILAAHIGGLFNRWEYIIAGDPLQQAAQAELAARPGQVMLSPAARDIIFPHSVPPNPLARPDWGAVVDPAAVENVLRCYVPRPVLAWLDEELHGWLASLRPMSVLFVGVQGLDYERDESIQKLHTFVRDVQQVIRHYQGSLPRLTVDDKGTVLLILFGAPPNAHEDDPERALRCGLDLQALTHMHDVQLTIGITTGRVFAGPVGSATRREYTVMGDTVNLAARLMAVAEPGQICCNYETYRSARSQMRFDPLPPVLVKGKGSPIQIYRPTGKRRSLGQTDELNRISETPVPLSVMMGCQAELARLRISLEKVKAGQGQIVVLEGEAGIGKSKLIRTFVGSIADPSLSPLIGRGRSVDQDIPYHPWQDVFYFYFKQSRSDDANGQFARQQRVMTEIDKVAPELLKYLPLLNSLFNLGLPENNLTRNFNPALRHQYLVSLVVALLQAWALEKPLVIILEDAHWLDVASWDLTLQLAQTLAAEPLPVYLLIATRSWAGSSMPPELLALIEMPATQYLHLDTMLPEDTLTVSAARLGLTGNELPDTVAELIRRRAGGNPFFAEELIYSLLDDEFITLKTPQNADGSAGKTRCLVSGDLERADQLLPATIQSTVLSRIDGLPPEEQLMLRIAAVIGHTFTYRALRDTLWQHLDMAEATLKAHLNDMVYLDLIQPTISPPNLTYGFKHIITREVTYQSLPFDRRRELHAMVAQWYEDTFGPASSADGQVPVFFAGNLMEGNGFPFDGGGPGGNAAASPRLPYYPLLVYHWHQAGNEEREGHYAALMAQQTMAQFAHAEALGYLNRALDLTPDDDWPARYKLLAARETIYNRRGNRGVQAQDLVVLAGLAKQIGDDHLALQVVVRQARFAEATSDYPAAVLAAEQVVVMASQIRDAGSEIQGYLVWGQGLGHQGDYDAAQEKLMQALSLAQAGERRADQAEVLTNLAIIQQVRGDYDVARETCQQALEICGTAPSTLQADIFTLLGIVHYQQENYQTARDYFEEAILIYYTRGEQHGELKPFYYIGLIYHYQGNYDAARDYFEQVLKVAREVEDRAVEAAALSSLGMVRCYLGDYDTARSYLAHSLEIREEIGSLVGRVDSFGKLGVVYHFLGDPETSQRYCELALNTLQTVAYKEGISYSLTYMGHAQLEQKRLAEAATSYQKALALRQTMEQKAAALDILAGLARVSLGQEDVASAFQYVNEILNFLATHRPEGVDNVFQVYHTGYEVLMAAGVNDPHYEQQARASLDTAYGILQEQLALIGDRVLQRIFLEEVALHQKIKTAWEKQVELA